MDAARQYIAGVMTRIESNTGTAYASAVGRLEKNQHGDAPRIEWEYGSITHEEPTAGNIYTEHQELVVTLWHSGADQDEAETNTRLLKNDLLRAAREVSLNTYVGGLRVGRFNWIEEANVHLGRKLEGTIEIPLAVPPTPHKQTVTILEVGTRGIAALEGGDEVVSNKNFGP
jgi:hypothetical protein